MSSLIANGRYPPVSGSTLSDVSSEERSSAIDFVNRHNFVFEEFDHAKITATFLPNAVVYHSQGTISGHEEMKKFFENIYGFFIPGISRSATNHVIDRDEDGGVLDVVRENGLPAIWWIGTNIDRLRMTSDGWKIFERYLATPFRNGALDITRAP
ncbi:hypothetical protein N7527_011734 [Penicillium freii]|nr:hypothetical protein N7527_011734 [Penicillium freii]